MEWTPAPPHTHTHTHNTRTHAHTHRSGAAFRHGLPSQPATAASAAAAAAVRRGAATTSPPPARSGEAAPLVRGPSPGHGRSAWVAHGGVVYTVAYPFGFTADDGVGGQTRKALASLDERLAQAGTDKAHILDATIYLGDMEGFAEMDAVWREYIPDGCGPSRATVGANLGGDLLVEMKIVAAAPAR